MLHGSEVLIELGPPIEALPLHERSCRVVFLDVEEPLLMCTSCQVSLEAAQQPGLESIGSNGAPPSMGRVQALVMVAGEVGSDLACLGGAPRQPQHEAEGRHHLLVATFWLPPCAGLRAQQHPALVVQEREHGAALAIVHHLPPALHRALVSQLLGDCQAQSGEWVRGRSVPRLVLG
jgi:hypothetical protein